MVSLASLKPLKLYLVWNADKKTVTVRKNTYFGCACPIEQEASCCAFAFYQRSLKSRGGVESGDELCRDRLHLADDSYMGPADLWALIM